MAKKFGGADVQKAVQLSTFDSAGVLVPVQQSGEVIEFLRPEAALLKLGVRTQPFKGELHVGRMSPLYVLSRQALKNAKLELDDEAIHC